MILDSWHAAHHVRKEMELYSPMVNEDSYMCVQDTFYDYPPAFHPQEGPGPWKAIQDFLEGCDEFEIDTSRDRLILTFNPQSILKRVKPHDPAKLVPSSLSAPAATPAE